MNKVLLEDLGRIALVPYIPFAELKGKTVLVTGGTGLIGSNVVSALVWADKVHSLGLKIVCLVRETSKPEKAFPEEVLSSPALSFTIASPLTYQGEGLEECHYILHAAGPTSSRDYVEKGVEVIDFTYRSVSNLLILANKFHSKLVYFSTMEVYGANQDDRKISEDCALGPVIMSARSSYPQAKRLAETLCRCHHEEYGTDTNTLRLTLTFGPGVKDTDNRVFADFAAKALNGQDLVMRTPGTTKRNYLYTADAASAVITVMLKGEPGEAYNVANEETYCSIREMAELVAETLGNGKSKVVVDTAGAEAFGYAPPLKINLDCSKLRALGWKPETDLAESFRRLAASGFRR